MRNNRRAIAEAPSWRSSKRWLLLGGLHAAIVVFAVASLVPSGVGHTAAPRRGVLEARQARQAVGAAGEGACPGVPSMSRKPSQSTRGIVLSAPRSSRPCRTAAQGR